MTYRPAFSVRLDSYLGRDFPVCQTDSGLKIDQDSQARCADFGTASLRFNLAKSFEFKV